MAAVPRIAIDDEELSTEDAEHISRMHSEFAARRAAHEAQKLKELQQLDKGESDANLSADRSGKFAKLRHRDSFFVTDVQQQRSVDGTDFKQHIMTKSLISPKT